MAFKHTRPRVMQESIVRRLWITHRSFCWGRFEYLHCLLETCNTFSVPNLRNETRKDVKLPVVLLRRAETCYPPAVYPLLLQNWGHTEHTALELASSPFRCAPSPPSLHILPSHHSLRPPSVLTWTFMFFPFLHHKH